MRRFLVVLAVLVALVVGVQRWGDQPPRDAVAEARARLGLPLETARVAVDPDGVSLFVVMAGPKAGPPVVLLHGFPEFWYAWSGVLPALAAAGFRVIAPDQRGYDASDKPQDVDAYRVDRLGDDAAHLIDALGYESAFVAAHDWGGGVAWNLAIRHPARVRKLAVLGTPHPDAYRHEPPSAESISWYRTFFQLPLVPEWSSRAGNWAVMAKMLRDTAGPGAYPDERMDLYRSAWDRDGAMRTMIHWYRAAFRAGPYAGPERRVAIPTLLLLSPGDRFIPPNLTRASLALLDDGRLVELPDTTHWALHEQPDRIGALLAAFFSAAALPDQSASESGLASPP